MTIEDKVKEMKEAKQVVVACCVCKQFYDPCTDEWYKPNIEEYKSFYKAMLLSHSYCKPCSKTII